MEVFKKNKNIITLSFLTVLGFVWLQVSEIPTLKKWRQSFESFAFENKTIVNKSPWNKKSSEIVIVDIDKKSLDLLGTWPWSRNIMSRLTNKVINAGDTIIAFDLYFKSPGINSAQEVLFEHRKRGENNPLFSKLLREYSQKFDYDTLFADRLQDQDIAFGFEYHNKTVGSKGVLPSPLPIDNKLNLRAVKQISNFTGNIKVIQDASPHGGFINVLSEHESKLKSVPLIVRYGNNLYPSLALQTARMKLLSNKIKIFTSDKNSENLTHIQIDEIKIPVDTSGTALLTYRGPPGTFPIISAADVINDAVPTQYLNNKIVIISSSVNYIRPKITTSLNLEYLSAEIHANVISSILTRQILSRPFWSSALDIFLLLVSGLVLIYIFQIVDIKRSLMCYASLSVVWIIYAFIIYHSRLQLVAISVPMLMTTTLIFINLVYRYQPLRQWLNNFKHNLFSLTPAKLVPVDDKTPKRKFLGKQHVSIMFIDIRKFADLSDALAIDQLNKLLNLYIHPISTLIREHHGQLTQTVDHMIMATWKKNDAVTNHANHAIITALKIIKLSQALKNQLAQRHLPPISLSIGIDSGDIKLNNLSQESQFTAGNAIQTAAKLADISEYYGVNCLIGEEAFKQTEYIVCRKLDNIQRKEASAYLSVFEPICERSDLDFVDYYELKIYNKAMGEFEQSDFDSAKKTFSYLLFGRPTSNLYKRFLSQIDTISLSGIKKNWRGMLNRRSL